MRKVPTWSKDYETGIKAIDNDHKALFEEIKRLTVALVENESVEAVEQAIVCLENYANEHFSREEKFMISAGYPKTEPHIRAHRSFSRQVSLLKRLNKENAEQIDPMKLVTFMSNWLADHIVKVDMDYVPHLHGEAEERDEDLEERLHEVNIHVPSNKRKVVEDFTQIITSDNPIATELTDLIAKFERRLEEHDLDDARATFCK